MSSANTLVELVRKASSINLASSQLSPCFPYLHILLTIMLIFHSILILRKSWQFICKSSWITLCFLIYMRIETVAQQNHLLWDFLIFVIFVLNTRLKIRLLLSQPLPYKYGHIMSQKMVSHLKLETNLNCDDFNTESNLEKCWVPSKRYRKMSLRVLGNVQILHAE